MKRRTLIAALGGTAAVWPLAVRSQQPKMPVIGYFNLGFARLAVLRLVAFRQGLGEVGYIEGQNVMINYRWAEGRYDRLPALVADLVGRKVDVIVAGPGTVAAQAARDATSTIPIVFWAVSSPVEAGLVTSLARPGSHITGMSGIAGELASKRLDLICELVPRAKVIALLVNPNSEIATTWLGAVQTVKSRPTLALTQCWCNLVGA